MKYIMDGYYDFKKKKHIDSITMFKEPLHKIIVELEPDGESLGVTFVGKDMSLRCKVCKRIQILEG